jgi:hypothetical protein
MSKTAKKNVKSYKPVARLPVAKFYYQGNHTHPVRRTVLIIEDTKESITLDNEKYTDIKSKVIWDADEEDTSCNTGVAWSEA